MPAEDKVEREKPRSERPPVAGPAASSRLVSLDVFRGLTIAGMVLVNNSLLHNTGGGGSRQI